MSIMHKVTRTDRATYLYLPATTSAGMEYLHCIGWVRSTLADPSIWEVRVPTLGGVSDWTAVDACQSRPAAERRLSELTGRTL